MESGQFASAGNHPDDLVRGLTFDLDKGAIFHVTSCNTAQRYGFSDRDYPHGNFAFRYGELLDLCERLAVGLAPELEGHAGHPTDGARVRGKIAL